MQLILVLLIWSFFIIIIMYFTTSIHSSKTVISKRKRRREEAIFYIMTRLSRCRAWNTSQVTFLVMFPIVWNIQIFCCNLKAVSPAVSKSSPGKAVHGMCSTWCRLLFQLEASRCFLGFLFFLSSSPTNQKKQTNKKQKQGESQNNAFVTATFLQI